MSSIPVTRAAHLFHGNGLWLDTEWKALLETTGIEAGSNWRELSGSDLVSGSYNTTSNYRFRLGSGETVFFKRYVYRKPKLKYWLQPSKAAVEAAGYNDLKRLGIETLQTLAYGEQRWLGFLKASFIVTLGIENTVELDQYLAREWFGLQPDEKRRQLNSIQPTLIRQLHVAHHAGFFHWDLKLRNILLLKDGSHSNLIWIDCPRSRLKKPNDSKSIIQDLAAMARVGVRVLTRGQRIRFLLDYSNGDRKTARELYRQVAVVLAKNPPRPFWHLLPKDDPVYLAEIEKWQGPR